METDKQAEGIEGGLRRAYADKNRGFEHSERQLDYISDPIRIEEVTESVLAIIGEYNTFCWKRVNGKLDVVEELDDRATVWIGRGGGPEMYISTKCPELVCNVFEREGVQTDVNPSSAPEGLSAYDVVQIRWV